MRPTLGLATRAATDRAEAGESRDLNRHIPSPDSLRGLAVLMVMIFYQTMLGSATSVRLALVLLLHGSLLGARVGSPLDSIFAGRFLVPLGINSYAFYLFHNPTQAIVRCP
ncbi:MAG TPA: hypothetical protein VFT74_08685 [Isosphaeraceae bacterium]|nr:hypothetical protein [Isosphaeraceae bacterium]